MRRRAGRTKFSGFVRYTFRKHKENWHTDVMDEVLEDVISGRLKEQGYTGVIFELPPRHGKSLRVSKHLPAAYLGRHPDNQVVHATYNHALAKREGRAVQRIMGSHAFHTLHPEVRLPRDRVRKKDTDGKFIETDSNFELPGYTGSYMATGIGGQLTGSGMHLGIIDDPIKNAEEADSENFREKIWDWYLTTFLTREEGEEAVQVICMTRWHEDDLVGRILENAKESGERWLVIKFEAIREDMSDPRDPRKAGDALWPGKFGIEWLQKRKRRYSRRRVRWWNALYQQRPSSAEGEIFKRDYWGWLQPEDLGSNVICKVQSYDTAHSKNDANARSVCGTFALLPGRAVLIEVWKDHVEFPDLKRTAKAQYNKHIPRTILIEDKASGKDLIPEMREMKGIPAKKIVPFEPAGDKIARANASIGMIEGGDDPKKIYLLVGGPGVDGCVDELAAFPTGKYSDQVDMMTQFCTWYRTEWSEPAERVLRHPKGRRRR